MKKILISLILLIPFAINAQNAQSEIIAKINATVSKISTMKCDFVQTKHLKMLNNKMTSNGVMLYKQSDKLRWEYKSPYSYTFVLNGSKVYLTKGDRKDVIDIKQNKIFKEIAQIMMNSVTGRCLTDTGVFNVQIKETSTHWIATLYPQKKTMKQMFTKIIINFKKQNALINSVEMHEKNGDFTIIELQNVELNKSINDNAFVN